MGWGKRHISYRQITDEPGIRLWGKRYASRLRDILQQEANKKNSWNNNNVRMWGKRSYDDDDEYRYAGYWPYQDPYDAQLTYEKRESKLPSSLNNLGQAVPHGWAKNAWERNNMRIWG